MILFVILVGILAVLAALRTDLVRIGPSSVTLPEQALRLSVTWYRLGDIDPEHDYYRFWIHVQNRVDSDSIVPYAIVVNISAREGETLGGWLPMAGDHDRTQRVQWPLDDSSTVLSLDLPAGYVNRADGTAYLMWNVQGERGLSSQAIFRDGADFLVDSVRFPENATMEAHVSVLLTWYYTNPFQAYPVASQTGTATCRYVPDPGSEGSRPYSACE